ncbi:thioredoxin family protein [Streptomyces sp. NPDC048603]|uniref:thioredoxin family protein n=1 Tax=Streptomyces sp. NPDC048603 TaxID=3365577 RepID=UPI00371003C1
MATHVHQPREDAEFDFVLGLASGTPILAYFTGAWPKALDACRAMDLVVRDTARERAGRLTVVRADMTRCPGATRRWAVASAPAVVLIEDGRPVAAHEGPLDHAGLAAFLDGPR